MKNKSFFGCLMLLLASFFWGSTFIVQSDAASMLPTFTYLAARSYVGAFAISIVIFVRRMIFRGRPLYEIENDTPEKRKERKKRHLTAGVCCGLAICVAAAFQQTGIANGATAGEAGFLTALYMFIVPVFSIILYKKKPTLNLLAGALFMTAGLYFLCIFGKGWSGFGLGHILIISSAFGYAVHIMIIDRFKDIDGLVLSAMQFVICAVASTVCALIFEAKDVLPGDITGAWFPILF